MLSILTVSSLGFTTDIVWAQLAGTESIQGLFPVQNGEVAAYDTLQKSTRMFVEEGGSVREMGKVSIDSELMALAASPQGGYAYATGTTRSDADHPIRVHIVSPNRLADQVAFEYSGERNQVTGLVWNQGKLWIDFFESKYFSKIGYLTPSAKTGVSWRFTEIARLRMGDSFDCLGDTLVVGRSYGDQQGEDGDLLLFRKGVQELLPSYRGVRAVRLFGDPASPTIVIADGWHANYGQVAQARISILRKRAGEGRYALEILDRDGANYGFSRLFVFELRGSRRIAALGNSTLNLYSQTPAGLWTKEVLYTRSNLSAMLDAAPARIGNADTVFVVQDGTLRTIRYQGS